MDWLFRLRQRLLPTPWAAARRARQDGKAEFEFTGMLRPALVQASAVYLSLLEHMAISPDAPPDDVLADAARRGGDIGRALATLAAPALGNPRRAAYLARVLDYAHALPGAIERQISVCRQLWLARQAGDADTQLLLHGAQDRLLIGLLEHERVFQQASAAAAPAYHPQHWIALARATLNAAMVRLLDHASDPGRARSWGRDRADALRGLDAAEAMLRRAGELAPRYTRALTRRSSETGGAPMETALRALRDGLEHSIATEQAIAGDVRRLVMGLDAPPMAVTRGTAAYQGQAPLAIAGLVARRLSPRASAEEAVRKP
ncbi:hypothetical protein [Iodidimonas sp. SYSU 1G8]|uniref:hypothetical protein n=1 Tax=Iodidimonas sp. SYSU 1G8 TaxID=3133967 RepID=UPI0031FF2C62